MASWGIGALGNPGNWEMGKCGNGNMGEWESGEMGRWRNGQTGTWGTGEQRKDMGKWGKGGMGKWGPVPLAQPLRFRKETTQESSCVHAHTHKVAFQILGLVGTAA